MKVLDVRTLRCALLAGRSSTSNEQTHHLSDCPIIRNHLCDTLKRDAFRAILASDSEEIYKRCHPFDERFVGLGSNAAIVFRAQDRAQRRPPMARGRGVPEKKPSRGNRDNAPAPYEGVRSRRASV